MQSLITHHRNGFSNGLTTIIEKNSATKMEFSILKLAPGENYRIEDSEREGALLHIDGEVVVECQGKKIFNRRQSVFKERPFAIHFSCRTPISISAITAVELAVIQTENRSPFSPSVFTPDLIQDEHRGKGMLDDTSYRYVRTIFDGSNSPFQSKLVLGEVVNFPGKWSSYPPHHHPQPEIYHYRFSDPRGYGHAELGEHVYKVKPFDTLVILDNHDHPQCAAPGYAMYYIWTICHLEGNRYSVPEFTEDHRWLMTSSANRTEEK